MVAEGQAVMVPPSAFCGVILGRHVTVEARSRASHFGVCLWIPAKDVLKPAFDLFWFLLLDLHTVFFFSTLNLPAGAHTNVRLSYGR